MNDDAEPIPICAQCIRLNERVRGCRFGRDQRPCSRCGRETTGRLIAPAPNDERSVAQFAVFLTKREPDA